MTERNPALMRTAWLGYRREVIPPDAPEVQVTESRRAFYAGAGALFSLLLVVLDPGEEPTEHDLDRVTGLYDELKEFNRAVARGEM